MGSCDCCGVTEGGGDGWGGGGGCEGNGDEMSMNP